MRLNHNMFSLSIFKTYKNRIEDNKKAVSNISNGSKLTYAKDNPGRIGKSETLKIQILTNDVASKNVQDANSMIQTFDGALQGINDGLARIRELTINAKSGTLANADKNNIQIEIDNIKKSIDDLVENTEFNGIKLSESQGLVLSKTPTKSIQTAIGTMDDEHLGIPIFDISIKNLGVEGLDVNNGNSSIDSVDQAIEIVSGIRSTYGSIQNTLEDTSDYLGSKGISIQTSQSGIADADIAEEMIKYSTSQLLIQSSTGLMAQSNNFPKDCLNILGNVK